MTLLAPGFLWAGLAAAVAMAALHLIVTRTPRAVPFPTARFASVVPVAASQRRLHLSDLLLLALRVLALVLVAVALARPVLAPTRNKVVRIVLADVSGAVADVDEVRDSARALLRPGDELIAFDTSAWTVKSADSLANRSGVMQPGSLSAALVAALRAGQRVRAGADSIELVVVSPVVASERDRATSAVRDQWAGRARLVRVRAFAPDSAKSASRAVAFAGANRPQFAVARNRIDTVGAVVADGNVLVGSFERRWRFTDDSLKGARILGRWVDGEPAAIERVIGDDCRQSVLIPITSDGDITLRPDFVKLRAALAKSCQRASTARDTTLASMIPGTLGRLASTADFPSDTDASSPASRWLVLLAIIVALIEMVLRRRVRGTGDPT